MLEINVLVLKAECSTPRDREYRAVDLLIRQAAQVSRYNINKHGSKRSFEEFGYVLQSEGREFIA
jgi:hypothetical protein